MKQYTLADLPKEHLVDILEELIKMHLGASDKLFTQTELRKILLGYKKRQGAKLYASLQTKERAISKARSRNEKNNATLAYNSAARRLNALVREIEALKAATDGDNAPTQKEDPDGHQSQSGTA